MGMQMNNKRTILDLNTIPLANNLKPTAESSISAKRYPLRLLEEDMTFRLDTQVDPSEMFHEYLYRSSVNEPYKQHCRAMWSDIQKHLSAYVKEMSTIVDIGGNDGTLLRVFKERMTDAAGVRMINVDPSISFVEENTASGIIYERKFWADCKIGEKANLIVSTNVFQHNSDVHGFLRSVKENLDGIWVLEFPYFLRTAQTNQFDQIYHEHYFYWLITPLAKLFSDYGLSIVSITEHSIHGGTIRIVSTNRGQGHAEEVQNYIRLEKEFDFASWGNSVKKKIESDETFIQSLLNEGKVACFGAGAKSCVYLNCIDKSLVDQFLYVVDDTPGKQGKFVPGTKLEVVDRTRITTDIPDCILVLIHNFKDHIIHSLRQSFGGKIVVLLPEVQVYS